MLHINLKTGGWVLFGLSFLLLTAFNSQLWLTGFQPWTPSQVDIEDKIVPSPCTSKSCYRYLGPQTESHLIESWPDVDFDIGEIYGGSLPIQSTDLNRTLYFVFKPAPEPIDDLVIWLNGGPGCSSLYGFNCENGPILWRTGATPPENMKNPFAWSEHTNMLWLDQPVGTGFSQGELEPINQFDLAQDVVGFLLGWQELFGIERYKIYLAGESFAGRYIPYIAAAMIDRRDKILFDISGAIMYSPTISAGIIEGHVSRYPFALAYKDILQLNQKLLEELESDYYSCGHAEYLEQYLQFPPIGYQPTADESREDIKCDDLHDKFDRAVKEANPCYNIYQITDGCPSRDTRNRVFFEEYLNRAEVKEALHAPPEKQWYECGNIVRATDETKTPPPIQHVLPRVIEQTNRVLISTGEWDGLILQNGTLLAIQNMTWNGQLGFQERPAKDFVVPFAEGEAQVMGTQHYERGLQWVGTFAAGHEQPMYQPEATLRHLEWMLGRIDVL